MTKGLPPAKSEASNSHGSVPFLSKLGDVRVRYIRKERTESGHNISRAANIHTARLSLLASFLTRWNSLRKLGVINSICDYITVPWYFFVGDSSRAVEDDVVDRFDDW